MEAKKFLMSPLSRKLFAGMLVAILFIVLCGSAILNTAVDNDTYWLVALGRSIRLNWIDGHDPLSLHSDMAFLPQQWLSAVVISLISDTMGVAGLSVLCSVLLFGTLVFTYLFAKDLCRNSTTALGMTCISGIFLTLLFKVARPHMFSLFFLVAAAFLLERYANTKNWGYLIPTALISMAVINFHASVWLILPVLFLPLIAEWVVAKGAVIGKLLVHPDTDHEKGAIKKAGRFPVIPLLVALLCIFLAGLFNPFRLNAMTYIFRSYGVEMINSVITEMAAPSLSSGPEIPLLLLALVCFALNFRKLHARHWFLAFGMTYLSLTSLKAFSFSLIFVIPLLGRVVPPPEDVAPEEDKSIRFSDTEGESSENQKSDDIPAHSHAPSTSRKHSAAGIATVIALVFAVSCAISAIAESARTRNRVENAEVFGVREVIDYAEQNAGMTPKNALFAGFNAGGYAEYKGYKPYLDARAEAFLKANNGKADYLAEYLRAEKSAYWARKLVAEYGFDYLITEDTSGISGYLHCERVQGASSYGLVYAINKGDGVPSMELWVKMDIVEKEGLELLSLESD